MKEYNPPIPFRASTLTLEQLNDLAEKWHLNRSQVIIHCITRTWSQVVEPRQEPQNISNEGSKKA